MSRASFEPTPAGTRRYGDAGDSQLSAASGPDTGPPTDKAANVAGTAKDEASQVAGTAVESGKDVARTAKDEAQNVVAETKQQAVSLLDTVRTEAREQVGTQQQRIAEAVQGLSKELDSMAPDSGVLADLAHQASRRGGDIADWLQDREPADVVDAVRSYARRRPVTFLVLCGVAGVVAGRLTRSTIATHTSLDDKDNGTAGVGHVGVGAGRPSPALDRSYAVATPAEPVSSYAGDARYPDSPTTGGVGPGYVSDPPLPGGGFVGTVEEPNGGLRR